MELRGLFVLYLYILKRKKRGTHMQRCSARGVRGPHVPRSTIINNLCLCNHVYKNVQAHVVRYRPSS